MILVIESSNTLDEVTDLEWDDKWKWVLLLQVRAISDLEPYILSRPTATEYGF